MTTLDDNRKIKQGKSLAKSLEAIGALRAVMEMKLAQGQKDKPAHDEIKEREKDPSVAAERKAEKAAPPPQPQPDVRPEAESEALQDPPSMLRLAERSSRVIQLLLARQTDLTANAPLNPSEMGSAFLSLANSLAREPDRFLGSQLSLWQNYIKLWQSMVNRLHGQTAEPVVKPAPGDKRFQDDTWQNILFFDYIKQSYLLNAGWFNMMVRQETEDLDPKLAHKIDFYSHQMVDAVAPSNFMLTNPEVVRATLASGGENLIKGLENLLGDLERGQGDLRITMSDPEAFKVGETIAFTKGEVIFENKLMQLIQYAPRSETVHAAPILLIPPWINKFYILDLREKNSFIRHLVDQGYTVFCISWLNPGETEAAIDFGDYMETGVLASMREIKRVTKATDLHLLGYCIGGTLLAMTLAWLKAQATIDTDLPKPLTATYLVTMVDFAEPGDLGVFIDDEQITTLEKRMSRQGYLEAGAMSATFNLLRANDLIWSFVINNYLLGKDLFPFDILYWNADATNLPAAMHSFYLREMYLKNKLVEAGGIVLKGSPLDLRQVDAPAFILSTRDDHIAPWRSTYAATQLYQGTVRFVLSGSGHIAGIVNPPSLQKYGYCTNDKTPVDPEDWLKDAVPHEGSWWPEWIGWLAHYSDERVPARIPQNSLEAAPGRYVKKRSG